VDRSPIPESLDGIVEIETHGDPGRGPGVLFEVPHGATDDAQFEAVLRRLHSEFPDNLVEFFRVNTDFGAPDLARAAARSVAAGRDRRIGRFAVVIRGLVPRTFVDLNRDLDATESNGMTPGLPPYVRHPENHAALTELWLAYQAQAAEAYAAICGRGGIGLALHTYAPRSIALDVVGDDVVHRLRAAYACGTLETWPLRPEADLILPIDGDTSKVHPGLVEALRRRLEARGVEVASSSTYRLVPATLAHRHALEYPGATACLEIRRDLVGAPWRPFDPSELDHAAVGQIGEAIAGACLDALGT
jgi:hypothetical protein